MYKTHLETMFEEKGIDLEQTLDIDGHIGFTVQMVFDYIYQTPEHIQEQIAKTFIKIDFQNGDVMHFVKYLAAGITKGF